MKTREEILAYGLSFPDTYQEAPFHDRNWQLVRIGASKKAFLWTYEYEGQMRINIKVDPPSYEFLVRVVAVELGWLSVLGCYGT